MKKSTYLLGQEDVNKAILTLAVPSILTSMINIVYNIISTAYLSALHNDAMIAATTVALPLTTILQSFGDGIGIGAASYIGRLLGEKKEEKTASVLRTAYTLAFFISLVLSMVMVIFLRQLMLVFKAEPDVVEFTVQYMRIILIGGTFMNFKQILSALLRAQGEVAIPTFAMISSVVISVILTPVFMYEWGLNLAIRGAAYATFCSNLFAMSVMLYRQCSTKVMIRWKLFDFGIDREAVREIFRVGFSAFTRQILPSFSQTTLYRAASPFGTAFLAALGIGKKSLNLITAVFMGFSRGVQPLTAFCYGGRLRKRLTETLKKATVFVLLYAVIGSIVYYNFGDRVFSLYTSSPEIIGYGKFLLKGYSLTLPLLGFYQLYATTLQAFGKSSESFWISVFKQVIFYIPFVLLLSAVFGQRGMYYIQPATDLCTVIMLLVLCRNLPREIREMEN